MIRYVFKEKPLTIQNAKEADAQRIGEALTEIKQKTKGRCNSKTVLGFARDRKHYLHKFFEWNNSVAAEKYRQEQARELMSCVDIVEGKGKKEKRLPAFVSLIDRGGRGYHTVQEVLDSEHLQDLALRQAEADLESYERRLAVFHEICDAIRTARELIAERRRRGGGKEGDRASA
jgi:hypothetical protein